MSICHLIQEIEGPFFVFSPYYGEKEFESAQYTARTYGKTIADHVHWSVQGADPGVRIDEKTGLLSIPPKTPSGKIKVIASQDGISMEKLIHVVGRYEGVPNILRLPGTSILDCAGNEALLPLDGSLHAAISIEKGQIPTVIRMQFASRHNVDFFRVCKDQGGYPNPDTAALFLQDTSAPFSVKEELGVTLHQEIWRRLPNADTDSLTYRIGAAQSPVTLYQMEAYSSCSRLDRIEASRERVPSGEKSTITFQALSENGELLSSVTYRDGETHRLCWSLTEQKEGVSIDPDTGILTIEPYVKPTAITVKVIYFGAVRYHSIFMGIDCEPAAKLQQDADWLTFEKLSEEPADHLTHKLLLPTVTPNHSTIQWSSSQPDFLSETGEITPPYLDTAKNIRLTAIIQNAGLEMQKEFQVTVTKPLPFADKTGLTDQELFGLWDQENARWIIQGKLDYESCPDMAEIGRAIQRWDYWGAKELLNRFTQQKFEQYPITRIPARITYEDPSVDAYIKNIITFGHSAAEPIVIGNERDWYCSNLLDAARKLDQFSILLHAEDKEPALVEIDSRESCYVPYIQVTLRDGSCVQIKTTKDTTIRAGAYLGQNYGKDKVLRVMDSGDPIDSNTQRAYLFFDLRCIPHPEDIQSAALFLHGENTAKSGNKKIHVFYKGDTAWEEESYCWNTTALIGGIYSWDGIPGGIEYAYPPGGDPEALYTNIARVTCLPPLASGYLYTHQERYAYASLAKISNFLDRAGEDNNFPRGFDGNVRNSQLVIAFKCLNHSAFMTPDVTTAFWKYFWTALDQIASDHQFSKVTNMRISMLNYASVFYEEFPEFRDLPKWKDVFQKRLIPLIEETVLPDGSYVEASDGYSYGSIERLVELADRAARIGIRLSPDVGQRIHKAIYYYAALHLPNGHSVVYGDHNMEIASPPYRIDFVEKMAGIYQDEVLRYMGANGKEGGIKPAFTSQCFPDSRRVFMRSGWEDSASYLMVNIDDGFYGHGHYDDLGVIAFAYDHFVIPDPGRYSYTNEPMTEISFSSENHNTLGRITDLKNQVVYNQLAENEREKTEIRTWASCQWFDYFSGNTKERAYGIDTFNTDGRKQHIPTTPIGYNRKILFVKPSYWIISDFIEDRDFTDRTENKYDIMFHLMPDSRMEWLPDQKGVCTNFETSTNVFLLSPDPDVEVNREEGYFFPQYGSYTVTDRIVFSKTKAAHEKVMFDTVVYPIKNLNKNVEVKVEKIPLEAEISAASAIHIRRQHDMETYDDYYYYSNEKNFEEIGCFPLRRFGEFEFDGECCFISCNDKQEIQSLFMIAGTTLRRNGQVIVHISESIPYLCLWREENHMKIDSSQIQWTDISLNIGQIPEATIFNGRKIESKDR